MKKLRYLSVLLLVGGIGIVIALFFLLLRDFQESRLFYLNMSVTILLLIVIYIYGIDLFGTIPRVSSRGPGYGVSWYGLRLYALTTITIVICSIVWCWSFSLCIVVHLILLLLLLSFVFLGMIMVNNVNKVSSDIINRKSVLQEINTQLSVLEIQCQLKGVADYMESINKLKESVRYITSTDNVRARELEKNLLSNIRLLTSMIEQSSVSNEEFDAKMLECIKLVELRKTLY